MFLKNSLEIIENQGIKFIHLKILKKSFQKKNERKILFTIDDGLLIFL